MTSEVELPEEELEEAGDISKRPVLESKSIR
jgi:hypothetical protein